MEYYEQGSLIVGACPVHQGTYTSAFNLNIDEDSEYFGRWFCNSHKCHEKYGRDMVGLCRGLMSINGGVDFGTVVKYCEEKTKDISVRYDFNAVDNTINFFAKEKRKSKNLLTREQVRSRLIIPSEWYINERKFSAEILNEFDVGYCDRQDSQMYGRVVFPVYDEYGKWMVGCCGRGFGIPKWINSKGFLKSSHLYAYHKAIGRAKEIGALVLVEGQGDTIRMHEAGICNTVGIFGSALSDAQEFLIQRSGVMNVVIAMDSDEAGKSAYQNIHDRLKSLFNVHKLEIPSKDIGEMSVEEVKRLKNQIGRFV